MPHNTWWTSILKTVHTLITHLCSLLSALSPPTDCKRRITTTMCCGKSCPTKPNNFGTKRTSTSNQCKNCTNCSNKAWSEASCKFNTKNNQGTKDQLGPEDARCRLEVTKSTATVFAAAATTTTRVKFVLCCVERGKHTGEEAVLGGIHPRRITQRKTTARPWAK